MVIQYKCQDCGADMSFDSNSGMLRCGSCGRQDNIADMQNQASKDEPIHDYEEFVDQTTYQTFSEGQANQYQCQNCGAILITEPDTTATTCSFCGSPIVLGDRLSGQLAPAKVIPFRISKQQAEEAFTKWCKKGLLTPSGFMAANRVKSIVGMYVPFWLYDINGRGEAHADCTRIRHYTQGDYDVTETKHYDVFRKVDVNYEKVPCDASEKMDDKLMDKLEPYHYSDLVNFNAPYLAGFVAEKYNYTDRELFPRVESRAKIYVDSYIRGTITGYDTVNIINKRLHINQKNADYTLLPVWMFCYDYNKQDHIFAMNGQTGKVVGKPPLSKGKIAGWFTGITITSFVIMRIITVLLGGNIL